jgi:hypothetical protein
VGMRRIAGCVGVRYRALRKIMDLVDYCICECVGTDFEVAFSPSLDGMGRRYNVWCFIASRFAREFGERSK